MAIIQGPPDEQSLRLL